MKNLILVSASTLTLLVSNGCSQRVEYIKVPCPTLITFDVPKQVFNPMTIEYEVK